MPWGINFDEQNGTFSGTPEEAGRYIVPVMVETNYGKDAKDVTIIVEGRLGSVYHLGTNTNLYELAGILNMNDEPDGYGFRRLRIPEIDKIERLSQGFAAHMKDGGWYVLTPFDCLAAPDLDTQSVKQMSSIYSANVSSTDCYCGVFPIDNVVDFYYGGNYSSTSNTLGSLNAYMLSDGTVYAEEQHSTGSGVKRYHREYSEVTKMLEEYNPKFVVLNDDSIGLFGGSYENLKKIATAFPASTNATRTEYWYLTNDGELYRYIPSSGTERLLPDAGEIKNFWIWQDAISSYYRCFANTSDNKLYAMGGNPSSYPLGLPEVKTYKTFELVGEYNVKKMLRGNGTFMLTEDGDLYHTGIAHDALSVNAHQEFTRIFEGFKCSDFAMVANTLLVVK